jgi:hypothetical protein
MKALVATALLFALTAAGAGTAANADPCAREKSRNCSTTSSTVNFNSVPEISDQIVNDEIIKQKPLKNPSGDPSLSTPYTGPMIGTSPRPGRTPTVGYYWSLD